MALLVVAVAFGVRLVLLGLVLLGGAGVVLAGAGAGLLATRQRSSTH